MPGELAKVHLDPTKLPALVATHVEVQIDSMVVIEAPLDAADCAATRRPSPCSASSSTSLLRRSTPA